MNEVGIQTRGRKRIGQKTRGRKENKEEKKRKQCKA